MKYWRPVGDDPISASKFGQTMTDLESLSDNLIGSGVYTGMSLSSPTGLVSYVNPGVCFFAGGIFLFSGSTITLSSSASNYVYIVSSINSTTRMFESSIVVNQTGVAPSNSMLLALVATDSSSVLSINYKYGFSQTGKNLKTIAELSETIGTTVSVSGAVSSVGLSMPAGFTITNSPVTTSGTIVVTTSLTGVIFGTGSGFRSAVPGTEYLTTATVGTAAFKTSAATGAIAGVNEVVLGSDPRLATTSAFSWSAITNNTTAVANNGYIVNSSSLILISLPASASAGNLFRIVGEGTGGWKLTQSAGQQVIMGNTSTTSGTSGYLQSSNYNDCIELLYTGTKWKVISSVGSIFVN